MNQTLHRTLQLDVSRADSQSRTVPAVVSTEFPVPRGGYQEVLLHDANNIDLSRAPLPLIESHDGSRLNIGTVEDLRVADRKLRGTVRFGKSSRASEVLADVRDGIVRSLSVGYSIDDYQLDGDTLRATRWQPHEVSLVAIPADPGAGLNRARPQTFSSIAPMNENTEGLPAADAGEHVTRSQRRAMNTPAAAELATIAERDRVAEINAAGNAFAKYEGMRELAAEAVRDGWGLDQFRKAALQRITTKPLRGYDAPIGEFERSASVGRGDVIGRALQSNALDDLRHGRTRGVSIPIEGSIATLRRALVSDAAGGATTQPAMYADLANAPKRPLTLLDLLQRLGVSAGSFEFNQLTSSFAYAAGYQSTQASTKPGQSFPMALQTAPICTIAAWAGISEQVIADAPALQQRIADLLTYGCMQKLEGQFVAGAGGAAAIKGLKTAGTAFTPTTGASNVDAIGEASAHLQGIGWLPSAVLLNPGDWHAIRIAKSSGSGEYLAGSYDTPAQPNIWGLPVVPTPSLAAGTAIVFDASQALLLDRQAAALQIGYDGNGLTQNVLTVRAELRAGLAVLAPTAIAVLTLA